MDPLLDSFCVASRIRWSSSTASGTPGPFDADRVRDHHEQRPGPRGLTRTVTSSYVRPGDNTLKLDETTIPGGLYLRLRLRGNAPEIYEQISPAFDALFALADHDSARPHIEYYKREGEMDCLLPILPVSR
ncbi:hypothetical protein GCM10010922_28220 [Microbacterium sorbitolivorans]|nr:hypothetical protein GCM10010922_28220 [Microbacterium sorbitolivorans]